MEEPNIPYDDGAFTMFLYTKGQRGILSAELKQFLTYFEQTTDGNACNTDLAELHKMVSRVRMDEEVELEEDTAIVTRLCDLIRRNPGKTAEELLPSANNSKAGSSELPVG